MAAKECHNSVRIGVNCYFLQSHVGGMKQYFLNLFRELLTCDAANNYVFFYFPHNIAELAELGTDRWQAGAVSLQRMAQIRQHLAGLDVYFCPINGLQPLPLPPIPTVATLADVQDVYYPQFFTPEDLFYRDWYLRLSSRLADRLITISQFSKQAMASHYHLPPEKLIVAYPCVDERFFHSFEIAKAPSYPLPERFILYPANRWHHKNHDGLLQAIQLLKEQEGLSISAVFTGRDVDHGYQLKEMAAHYDISDLVYQIGYLSVEEMAYLYRKARLLVFPSLFEGFGIPLVEAMIVGCPIAAAKRTSLPEVAGEAALYFDPTVPAEMARAIKRLWFDADLRVRLIELGRQRAQIFSPAQMAQAHLEAFSWAIRGYSARRYWANLVFHLPFHLLRVGLKRTLGVYRQQMISPPKQGLV
jgi:glycosyltransferase involved in cell wall biosynthesis